MGIAPPSGSSEKVERIDAEVVAAVDNAIEHIVVGQVTVGQIEEHGPGDQERECRGSLPLRTAPSPSSAAKASACLSTIPVDPLVDDLRREGSHPNLPSRRYDDCSQSGSIHAATPLPAPRRTMRGSAAREAR